MENEDTTRIRECDWIFNALWGACADKRVPQCCMNIPATVIFKEGMPIKGVETNRDSGYIQRINLEDDKYSERDLGENGMFQAPQHRQLRALRKILMDFSDVNGHGAAQSNVEEPFVASVRTCECLMPLF